MINVCIIYKSGYEVEGKGEQVVEGSWDKRVFVLGVREKEQMGEV